MELPMEKRFRDICDWLAYPVVTMRPDRTIIAANRHFLEKYGLTQEEVIQKKCHELFFSSDELCEDCGCTGEPLLEKKEGYKRVRKTANQDGSYLYEEIQYLPILDEEGDLKLVVATIVDITPSKEIQADLKKTKEFLERIINSSVRAIVAADMKGAILLMNESARKLFGYTDEEIGGKVFATDGYAPEVAREIMHKLRSPEYGGVGIMESMKMDVSTTRGEKIPVEMSASVIYDEEGKEMATMAIFEDLRPKIEAEKKWERTMLQLMQSQKLASIGRVAAGVAHEINNPLSGIVMYTHLALEELPAESPAHEILTQAATQAERCRTIVRGLLDFSRHGEPEFEPLNVNAVIEDVLTLVSVQAMFREIQVIKRLDPTLPSIKGDRSQLQQVFMNLAVNAAEAMEGGGELTIETAFRGSAIVTFTDTGCGVREEDKEKIFEPFFTTKSERGGNGLGLAISHGIITRHGGIMSFESKENKGTSFIIRLPVEMS